MRATAAIIDAAGTVENIIVIDTDDKTPLQKFGGATQQVYDEKKPEEKCSPGMVVNTKKQKISKLFVDKAELDAIEIKPILIDGV